MYPLQDALNDPLIAFKNAKILVKNKQTTKTENASFRKPEFLHKENTV